MDRPARPVETEAPDGISLSGKIVGAVPLGNVVALVTENEAWIITPDGRAKKIAKVVAPEPLIK